MPVPSFKDLMNPTLDAIRQAGGSASIGEIAELLIQERKALIRNFVEGIEVVGDEATLTYTMPYPPDNTTIALLERTHQR